MVHIRETIRWESRGSGCFCSTITNDLKKARAKCRRLEDHFSTDLDTTDLDCKSRKRRRPDKYREETVSSNHGDGDSSHSQRAECVNESQETSKKKNTVPDVPSLPEFEIFPVTPQRKESPSVPDDISQDVQPSTSTALTMRSKTRLETTVKSPVIRTKTVSSPRAPPPVLRENAGLQLPVDSYERDRKIFTVLMELKTMVRQTMMTVNRLSDKVDGKNTPDEPIDDFGFPLKSPEDVKVVEGMLMDKSKFRILTQELEVRHLNSLGGFSTKEIVGRMMALLFTTELARQFNWTGQGTTNKQAMKSLRLTAALKEATRSKATEAEVESAITLWLKNSIDRDGGRKIRSEKKKEKEAEKARKLAQARMILASSSDSGSDTES